MFYLMVLTLLSRSTQPGRLSNTGSSFLTGFYRKTFEGIVARRLMWTSSALTATQLWFYITSRVIRNEQEIHSLTVLLSKAALL